MPEDVSVLIDGRRWHRWNSIEFSQAIDSFSQATITAPFEPDRQEFRDTFRPFSFKPIEIFVGDVRRFTGTLVEVDPSTDENKTSVKASGYSRSAVLQDVTPPASEFPLEFNDLKLDEIASRLASPFGIGVQVDADVGAPFDRVAVEPDAAIFDKLSKLAKQRGVILSDTPEGDLRILRSRPEGNPVAVLEEGKAPLSSVSPSFSPQDYFSQITGVSSTKPGRIGEKFTVPNPHLRDVFRPLTFKVDDGEDADLPTAIGAKMGRMFGNMLEVSVECPTWRDPQGALWSENTTVMLTAPGAMIYRRTGFIVRDVAFNQETDKETAAMTLVLPGSFSGKIPGRLPWD